MKRFKNDFWIIVTLYYIIELLTVLEVGFSTQVVVRSILALLLFYYLYVGKNWSRIVWLILMYVAVIFGFFGIAFNYVIGFGGLWLSILQFISYAYILYTLSKKRIKLAFKN